MYIWKMIKSEFANEQVLDYKASEYNQKRENVYVFLRLPWALEKFMLYGFLQCADSFLYISSVLPLRVLSILVQALFNPFAIRVNIRKLLEPSRMVDICKLVLMLTCYFLLTFIDTSMVYHMIRGQAIIKLYIFFNLLEVADRLLCSIGHDVLEALYWTATEPKKNKLLVLPHLFLAVVYVFFHSVVILGQTTTLNVAFNSYNKALLTIMMSNNFVELKGSVFKKFDKNILFQMSCSDVKERFYNLILLLIIFIRNMAEFDWQLDQLLELVPAFCAIFFSEFFIDWTKHAFVLKFNDISAKVFDEFKMTLAYNYIESAKKKGHYDLQSHRYGFIPIPLFCLLMRICTQSIRLNNEIAYVNVFVGFICVLALKLLNHIILVGLSCKWIEDEKRLQSELANACAHQKAQQQSQQPQESSGSSSPNSGVTKKTADQSVSAASSLASLSGPQSTSLLAAKDGEQTLLESEPEEDAHRQHNRRAPSFKHHSHRLTADTRTTTTTKTNRKQLGSLVLLSPPASTTLLASGCHLRRRRRRIVVSSPEPQAAAKHCQLQSTRRQSVNED